MGEPVLRTTIHPTAALIAAAVLFALFVQPSAGAENQSAEPRDIGLEYVFKREELGIPPVNPSLPRDFQWSPKGVLLAYKVAFATEEALLTVYDAALDATRFVLTPSALHRAVIELASKPGGIELESPARLAPHPAGATNIVPIGRHQWDGETNRLRLDTGKGRFWLDLDTLVFTAATEGESAPLPEGEKLDVTDSPDQRFAAYTRGNALYAHDRENGREIPLAEGGETLLQGRLPWVYWEEFFLRASWKAFWWSPDSSAIAYLNFDESACSAYPVVDYSSPVPSVNLMRYPKAGTANPTVRLGVVRLSTRETQWIDLGQPYEYIARVCWTPDGSSLIVQVLNRPQNGLTVLRADPRLGTSEILFAETSDDYVEVHHDPVFLPDGQRFLWLSDRDGYRHLYLYNLGGECLRQLTRGKWEVEYSFWNRRDPYPLDENRGEVYFHANPGSPGSRTLCRVPLHGGNMETVTARSGIHRGEMSADFEFALDSWTGPDTPRRIEILDRRGKLIRVLGETSPADYAPYRIRGPEFHEFEDSEGRAFRASLLKPAGFDPNRRYPVIFHVYGGPAGQVVREDFASPLEMAFVNRGFLLFKMDNRGTPGRGREWTASTHGRFGTIELDDLRAGAEYVKTLPFADPDRMGIWGWSHGGYITCCAMLKTPGVFRAGAAVAPVTDWLLYDTVYTERYMGLPSRNRDGYRGAAPVEFAENLEGALLLAHGVADDNVHIQNAHRLAGALVEAGKDFQLYLYPEKDHGIGGDAAQLHLYNRILDFFEENLTP